MDSYKGVRDFYPEDQRIQNFIFSAMRRAVESFGYEEMNASILEPTELYRAKSSEEIVNEQTYTFMDRGERSVTLRPEMTPTVARMVAARKRELGYPLRWYSIQNFFRYERPQRGRVREFWQLNVDLFGVSNIDADVEVIAVAERVMRELGASSGDYKIHLNHRGIHVATYSEVAKKNGLLFPEDKMRAYIRLLDRRAKLTTEDFENASLEILGEPLAKAILQTSDLIEISKKTSEYKDFEATVTLLDQMGIQTEHDMSMVRGFDYYTGMIFEVFDTNPENKRSMFGGGRYDNLVGQYGNESVPAIGFAMGDVIARDFLETHKLMSHIHPSTKLYIAPVTEKDADHATRAAAKLRALGLNVAVGMKHTKVGDHIRAAVKLGIPYFIAYGENEASSGSVTLKTLATEEERMVPLEDVPRACAE
ncbi:MAG: histidine--tRNA ligase [Patescibacteria group bacterium]